MKRHFLLLICIVCLSIVSFDVAAQCSICTKTAMQLGNKPAQGLNAGILYLMSVPFIAIGVVSYKWWKSQNGQEDKKA